MSKILLDTNVLIDLLKNRKDVAETIRRMVEEGQTLGCCCINIAEIYAGMRSEERGPTESLLDSLEYYEITREAAKLAGQLRSRYKTQGIDLETSDTLIAACAIHHQLLLMTANKKHFPMPELKMLTGC